MQGLDVCMGTLELKLYPVLAVKMVHSFFWRVLLGAG